MRKFIHRIWWKLVPGTIVKVKWPKGWVVLHEAPDGSCVSTESADPNDHYRPWMEANVGRQNWDWSWDMRDNDVAENVLSIKFRKGKEQYASMVALKWM
jgi:hypothetical protein